MTQGQYKNDKLYDDVITLLMGLYYHKSPKQHQNLRQTFEAPKQVSAFPTGVDGNNWVDHMVLAIEIFVKSYKAINRQLEYEVRKFSMVTAADKSRGYLMLSTISDVLGYIHILLDTLKPLKCLSMTLQSNNNTLAEVQEKWQ